MQLASLLERLMREKKRRATIVHVWAPPIPPGSPVEGAVRKLKARRTDVRWTMPAFEPSLEGRTGAPPQNVEDVVLEAVRLRVRASQSRAERAMRGLGVRPRPVVQRAKSMQLESSATATPSAERDREEERP